MRSKLRLQRLLAARQLGGGSPAVAGIVAEPTSNLIGDVRLFALTFAAGFLFTSIFIA